MNPPTPVPSGTVDRILDTLNQLSQAQTDTLALIVLIVFLFVVGLIVTVAYLVYRSRAKVMIPAKDGTPAQAVSEKEYLGVVLNLAMERLEHLNTQNDKLNARLEQSIAAHSSLTPVVERLTAAVSATSDTNASITTLSGRIDDRLQKMEDVRKETDKHMTEINDHIKDLSESDKALVEKVSKVLELLDAVNVKLDVLDKRIASVEESLKSKSPEPRITGTQDSAVIAPTAGERDT